MLRSAYHFLIVALIGCLAGYLLRVYVVQPPEMGAICSVDTAPTWCVGRDFLIQWMVTTTWGKVAICFIVISLFLKMTPAKLVLLPGLFFAGVSLFLFGPLIGAAGVVTGLVRGITLTETLTDTN